jgi:hypothetical protein
MLLSSEMQVTAPNYGKLIFVTGASRSGTTLMCRILGNHSAVLALKELHFFGELADVDRIESPADAAHLAAASAMMLARQARDFWVSGPNAEEREQAKALVESLPQHERTPAALYATTVAHMANQASKVMCCEQTPRNIFYAKKLLEMYPEARVVHMVRDPRAVLASQKNRWRLRQLGGKNVPWSEVIRLWFNYHPVTMSRLWRQATQVALGLEQHPRCTLLRFEDLVAEPESTVRSLLDWLALSFEETMLDVPQWGSSNIEHGKEQGVSADMAGKWRDVLSAGEISISERLTGAELRHFDYPQLTQNQSLPVLAVLAVLVRYPIHIVGAVLTNPRRVWIQLRALLRPS